MQTISKSQFKPRALEFLRQVENNKQPLVITNYGKPVAKIIPYSESTQQVLKNLRGSVTTHGDIVSPIAEADWEAAQ